MEDNHFQHLLHALPAKFSLSTLVHSYFMCPTSSSHCSAHRLAFFRFGSKQVGREHCAGFTVVNFGSMLSTVVVLIC